MTYKKDDSVRHKMNYLMFESTVKKFKCRKSQTKFMEWVKKPLESGKKFIILEAPPGTGKSLISQLYIKNYKGSIDTTKFDLLTCNKNLQQQYLDTFPYLCNLWGKSNYTCEQHNNSCEYGKSRNTAKKTTCENCPYDKAYSRWSDGAISLTNFHIHNIYSLFNKEKLENRDADVLIVDECHTLEPTISSFVSFKLSKKIWSKFVSDDISIKWFDEVFSFDTEQELINWLYKSFLPEIEKSKKQLTSESFNLQGKSLEDNIYKMNAIESITNSINVFLHDYTNKISEWVLDKKYDMTNDLYWEIEPLWCGKILKKNIWDKYKNVLLMSGTIIDPQLFCEVNGIPIDDVAFLRLGSPFPKENRPIYYYPQGKMTYKNKLNVWSDYVIAIKKILKKHKGKKGIIHCGNYELAEWLSRDINDKRLIFANTENRQQKLDEHLNSTKDTVLVSPSMKQGVDLKDDLSRFQIILKVPYPNLSSKVFKTRFQQNERWYSWVTIMDIVQSYGRSIRTETDYADTFILDSCFMDILIQNENMFPKYFKEVIKTLKSGD